jgi:hypothetical protein
MGYPRQNRRMFVPRLVTISLLATLSCAPRGTSVAGPGGEPGNPVASRFDPSRMDGWRCQLVLESRLGASAKEIAVTTTTVAFIPIASDAGFGLQVREVSSQLVIGGATLSRKLDTEHIEIVTPKEHRSQRADDDPDTRRVIEAVTGDPPLFVDIDTRAKLVTQRGRLAPEVVKLLPDLTLLGVAWMFGLPELPRKMAVGAEWEGLRPFPAAGPQNDMRLHYRVERIDDTAAHVAIEAESTEDLPLGLRGRLRIDGVARIRPSDAAFLGATVDLKLDLEGADAPLNAGWRYESSCTPPPSVVAHVEPQLEAAPMIAEPAAAVATPSDELLARARDHFAAGQTAFRLGDFPRALHEFSAAEALVPRPELRFNMSRCREHMGDRRLAGAR